VRAACIAAAAAVAWGCADHPTAGGADAVLAKADDTGSSAQRPPVSPAKFACLVSDREPDGGGYRYLVVPLHFGQGQLGDGGTAVLRYRGYGRGATLEVAANCIIPNSERAATAVSRRLGRRTAEPAEDGLQLQGCAVSDSGCMIEGLDVKACQYGGTYPDCREPLDSEIPECYDGGGCGGGPVIYTGGGPTVCEECLPPEEEQPGPNCPSLLGGKVITMGIVIAGRMHTFKFSGLMSRLEVFDSSPTWYAINPTTSEDSWWMATRGKILVSCWGVYLPTPSGTKLWVGTASGVAGSAGNDISVVMGPGHPSF
jgi:hypothetical protein